MPSARELGLIIDGFPTGQTNSIIDVPGVRVGHQTINHGDVHTGVTAILPHGGDLFLEKVPAAVEVINGFGKSAGLLQVVELGNLETPILLSNTFAVGTCCNALIRQAIISNPEIGRTTSTVNPVVCECNDGWLSDIQALAVTEDDVFAALEKANDTYVPQGAVGAGTGMRCFGFKGGIGTSSRRVPCGQHTYNLGVLVLTNFGGAGKLRLPDGRRPDPQTEICTDKGSVIVVLATDAPTDVRQLKRITKRCGAGLASMGSFWGHGSGDICVGFSTALKIYHNASEDVVEASMLNENRIDAFFEAAAECTAEAVLNSMVMAEELLGKNGNFAPSLAGFLA